MKLGNKKASLKGCFSLYLNDESGATAIEYGLLVALIAIAMVAGLQSLGSGNEGSWAGVSKKVSSALNN